MTSGTYDIAIIGAGPGGTACALALHGSGLRVVLVDKETFPRDKVCGDAIPGDAFKAMNSIHPAWGQQMKQFLDKHEVTAALGFTPKGKSVLHHWVNYSYNSKRTSFDNFLVQLVRSKTATTIVENKRLQKVSIENELVDCRFQDGSCLQASVIIGCDGANSVVTRQMGGLNLRSDYHGIAVRAYFRGVEGIQKGVNEFHFFKELVPGYFWIFPLENGWSNVGFGLFSNGANNQKNRVNLRETLERITQTFPAIAPRFQQAEVVNDCKGFALPLGTQKRPISGERFMLCGDAAALIDPIGGHGIGNAMWNGLFAAKQAIKCFEVSDFSSAYMSKYDKAVYKKMGTKLFLGTCLMKLIKYFPGLFTFLSAIMQSQKFANRVIKFFKI